MIIQALAVAVIEVFEKLLRRVSIYIAMEVVEFLVEFSYVFFAFDKLEFYVFGVNFFVK